MSLIFVKCKDKDGETVLLNAERIKLVRRHYRYERADIVEDTEGNTYECFHSTFLYPSFVDCIIKIDPEVNTGTYEYINE